MIVEITEERANEVIEKVAKFVAERHMASAAILAIESLRPLSFIGSQALFLLNLLLRFLSMKGIFKNLQL